MCLVCYGHVMMHPTQNQQKLKKLSSRSSKWWVGAAKYMSHQGAHFWTGLAAPNQQKLIRICESNVFQVALLLSGSTSQLANQEWLRTVQFQISVHEEVLFRWFPHKWTFAAILSCAMETSRMQYFMKLGKNNGRYLYMLTLVRKSKQVSRSKVKSGERAAANQPCLLT